MTKPQFKMQWDGECFKPSSQFWQNVCDRNLVVGEQYMLVEEDERSIKSHNHFFALVNDVWRTLPEKYDGRWVSGTHFRKYLLIKAGYCMKEDLVFTTDNDAITNAAACKRMDTEYRIISVDGNLVTIFTAESQRTKGPNKMPKDRFQQSKSDLIEIMADMLDITAEQLVEHYKYKVAA